MRWKSRYTHRFALMSCLGALLLLGFVLPQTANATHFRGQYVYAEPTGITGEVQITAVQFWRYSAFGSNFSVFDGNEPVVGDLLSASSILGVVGVFSLGDGNTYGGQWEVIGFDATKDWVIIRAVFVHQYASPGLYDVGISSCCRISTLENGWDDERYRVRSQILVDNTNVSVTTSSGPFVGVSQGTNVTYQIPFTNPDGDQIRFRLAPPSQAGAGFSDSNPPNLSIDPLTGLITWDNSGLTQGTLHALQVVIEEYDPGVDPSSTQPKATVVSDFIFEIGSVGNQLPVCTFDPASPLTVDLGQTASFDVTGSDAVGDADDNDANGNTVSVTATSIPAGATLSPNPATGVSPQVATFNWTPTTTGTFNAQFAVGDGLTSTLCTATINVEEPPVADTEAPVCGEILPIYDDPSAPTAVVGIKTNATDDVGISRVEVTGLANLAFNVKDATASTFTPLALGESTTFASPAQEIEVRADRLSMTNNSFTLFFDVFDEAGNVSTCDPVVTKVLATIPSKFALRGNYPNPVQDYTRIGFNLAESAHVSVEVFDMTGRRVATVVDQAMTPGEYEVEWNAGELQLPSGVYLYRMTAGSYVASQRMTIVR